MQQRQALPFVAFAACKCSLPLYCLQGGCSVHLGSEEPCVHFAELYCNAARNALTFQPDSIQTTNALRIRYVVRHLL